MNTARILIGVFALAAHSAFAANTLSLHGAWRFELDRDDAGLSANWPARSLPGTVQMPVDLAAQGIGDPPSVTTKWTSKVQYPNWFKQPEFAAYTNDANFKHPFWLTQLVDGEAAVLTAPGSTQ